MHETLAASLPPFRIVVFARADYWKKPFSLPLFPFIREYTGKVDELIKDNIEAKMEESAKENVEKEMVAQQEPSSIAYTVSGTSCE
ncbi:hypothetical protein KSP40_PGU010470 [Platanthera guangdongensis]|uniref:Uncharacterized protein n=1 Tax=Platanthera guangdongensis TaxID=2320717 RepID=A0ABR2N3S6_9ASPA